MQNELKCDALRGLLGRVQGNGAGLGLHEMGQFMALVTDPGVRPKFSQAELKRIGVFSKLVSRRLYEHLPLVG